MADMLLSEGIIVDIPLLNEEIIKFLREIKKKRMIIITHYADVDDMFYHFKLIKSDFSIKGRFRYYSPIERELHIYTVKRYEGKRIEIEFKIPEYIEFVARKMRERGVSEDFISDMMKAPSQFGVYDPGHMLATVSKILPHLLNHKERVLILTPFSEQCHTIKQMVLNFTQRVTILLASVILNSREIQNWEGGEVKITTSANEITNVDHVICFPGSDWNGSTKTTVWRLK